MRVHQVPGDPDTPITYAGAGLSLDVPANASSAVALPSVIADVSEGDIINFSASTTAILNNSPSNVMISFNFA